MINNITFSGNLGRDAELRYTPNGVALCSFAVPCTSGYGDNKRTTWVECVIWRDRAEKVHPALKKGVPVVVSGEFSLSDPYTKKNGDTVMNAKCTVHQLQFNQPRPEQKAQKPQPVSQPGDDFEDDDVPF